VQKAAKLPGLGLHGSIFQLLSCQAANLLIMPRPFYVSGPSGYL
jgi:hypothetical protein